MTLYQSCRTLGLSSGSHCLNLIKNEISMTFCQLWARKSGQRFASWVSNDSSNHFLMSQTLKDLKKSQESICFTSSHTVRRMSGTIMAKISKEIDLDKLREEFKKDKKDSGEQIQFVTHVQKLVAEKCAETIANLSETEMKRLRVLQLEHNFLYSEGHDIPDSASMTDEHWVEAMALPSKAQRLNYYVYIQKKMYTKQNNLRKKAEHKELLANKEQDEPYEHGRIFMRIYPSTMKRWQDYRLAHAMQHGTPLVFDMDYADVMRSREQQNTSKQLHDVHCLNRADSKQEPFHLFLTSCPESNIVYKLFQIRNQEMPFVLSTVTEESYLDLFDRDRLVYLTPHAPAPMKEFDHNAVYIVGALNDKALQKPVSYAKAKEQGIKCQRLPIDEYISWNQGTKSLTLDQMIKILLDKKNNLSWDKAFKAIPQRKLRTREDLSDNAADHSKNFVKKQKRNRFR